MRKRHTDDWCVSYKSQSSFQRSSGEPSPLSPTDSTGSVFISSESENGTEERKKSGRPSPQLSQLSPDAEYFEHQRKISISRSKTVVDNTFFAFDGKNDSKPERKKHASNQFKANAHFHKLFLDVPIDEPLRQNFTCALQKEILYQGKLFISENWICFHSKVFGKDTKITIPVHSVTLIKKTKTALLVPNALVITTVSDRYIFVSFLSRDTAYKLLKSVCRHLEDFSVGNSPNPSSPENSFRGDRPTTLPLDFNEDFCELDGIIHQRRQEMEESSSTGSQTPELEHFQEYHLVGTQAHLKASQLETNVLHANGQSKHLCDDKVRNTSRKVPSGILGYFHEWNYQTFLSTNHILILYAVLVCALIFSTFYMRYKIHILEDQLGSMTSFRDSYINEHPVQEGLASYLNLNADSLCEELTANLIRLEKIQSNLQRLLEDKE
uniref:GRAM domain containing 2B n=1 Tax=Anolis carolinensis TaxID=28377 RepID=A0A803T7I2_ANOCA|nr:PREDICTED: GRAM domain-containing protein 3 isoform X1 [Anolis carolinensis]|eukprot:XP_008112282.1 PREDICTED: GRAM domain-containing protein 3 isoform X1 [Anolis carolinensis]